MNDLEKIKSKLAKRASGFITGGFKPTNSNTESWIGRVYLYLENEEIPVDNNGDLMLPLFQLCLNELPFVPDILTNTKIITVFISKNIPMDLTPNGNHWVLREYKNTNDIIFKDLKNESSHIKPFPLSNKLIEEDYPVWEDPEIPEDISDKILQLEDEGIIDSYYDIIENNYGHKLGGYATYSQSGVYFGDDYEFVVQISSDEKANLNIVDNGNIYLAKNRKTEEWMYYIDFY